MLRLNKSIKDLELLWMAGFFTDGKTPDLLKLAIFAGVSLRTAQRWHVNGLPERVKQQLIDLNAGTFLPPSWQKHGFIIAPDRIYLRSGHSVTLDVIKYWPFISKTVDYTRLKLPDGARLF